MNTIGKRRCIGENLSYSEVFIFLTYFYQKYETRLCQDPKPSLTADPTSGVVRWPQPYKLILRSRY